MLKQLDFNRDPSQDCPIDRNLGGVTDKEVVRRMNGWLSMPCRYLRHPFGFCKASGGVRLRLRDRTREPYNQGLPMLELGERSKQAAQNPGTSSLRPKHETGEAHFLA